MSISKWEIELSPGWEKELSPAGQLIKVEYDEITPESSSVHISVIENRLSKIFQENLSFFNFRDKPLLKTIQKKLYDYHGVNTPLTIKIQEWSKTVFTINPFLLLSTESLINPLEEIFVMLSPQSCHNFSTTCKALAKRTTTEKFVSNVAYRKLEQANLTNLEDIKLFQEQFGYHLNHLPYISLFIDANKNQVLAQQYFNMSEWDLHKIVSLAPHLIELDLEGFTQISDVGLENLGNICPTLRKLTLSQWKTTKSFISKSSNRQLLQLKLGGKTNDKKLKSITTIFKSIEDLQLTRSDDLTLKGFKNLLNYDSLTCLDIRCGEWFNKEIIASLAKLSNLKKLSLDYFHSCSSNTIKSLKILGQCTSLENLEVQYFNYNLSKKLKLLPGLFPHITTFFPNNLSIQSQELTALIQMCPNMQTLSLTMSHMDEAYINSLGSLPASITTLKIHLGGASLEAVQTFIRHCPQLKAIKFTWGFANVELILGLRQLYPNLDI